MPGQGDPVYPPGQFSGWNRPSTRAAWLGMARAGDAWAEGDAEPGYSALAVSDPSADATSTQTWAAIDDTGWPPARQDRDLTVHSDADVTARARPAGPAIARPGAGDHRRHRGTPRASRDRHGLTATARGTEAGPATAHPVTPAGPPPGADGSPPDGQGGRRHTRGSGTGGPARGHTGQGASPSRRSRGLGRSNRLLLALLAAPVAIVVGIVSWYVYVISAHSARAGHLTPGPSLTPSSPAASLGQWKNIVTRAVDPQPLTLGELFPSRFSAGGEAGTRTVQQAGTKCTKSLIGTALQKAVRSAGCTQVMRASYLSSDRKLMATIGVLNLVSATAAKRAGKASGPKEFIKQLPASHGPTHKLTKGTGLEEAEAKGHYLILIWAEFANLHTPSHASQRKELLNFSTGLINGTVNVSLTSRMVTGKPHSP